MEIKRIEYEFTVCRLPDFSQVDWESAYCFAGRTDEEYSLVCITEKTPGNALEHDSGWRAFRIQGVLEFSLVGILSEISSLLAENGIAVFALSTYNTDYILTKKENFSKALELLSGAGYTIV